MRAVLQEELVDYANSLFSFCPKNTLTDTYLKKRTVGLLDSPIRINQDKLIIGLVSGNGLNNSWTVVAENYRHTLYIVFSNLPESLAEVSSEDVKKFQLLNTLTN